MNYWMDIFDTLDFAIVYCIVDVGKHGESIALSLSLSSREERREFSPKH